MPFGIAVAVINRAWAVPATIATYNGPNLPRVVTVINRRNKLLSPRRGYHSGGNNERR